MRLKQIFLGMLLIFLAFGALAPAALAFPKVGTQLVPQTGVSTKKVYKKVEALKTMKKAPSRNNSDLDWGRIVKYAMSLQGTPYRGGGSSPKGFDCSGFTKYVFKNAAAIELPHSSASQYGLGASLTRENLVPAALVFFNTSGKGISHVGIYIGDNKFIHSSSSKGVAVDSLNDKYWSPRYRGARLVK